jgi:prefoldin subunit 5
MSLFNEIFDTIQDVETSLTRMVTDSVIDLTNAATGFHFNDELEKAKKEMSNAGILNATDSIEKHFYSFLKDMECEARNKYQELLNLNKEGMQLESQLKEKRKFKKKIVDDIEFLMQISLEAKKKFETLKVIPNWGEAMEKFGVVPNFFKSNDYISKWNKVSETLNITMVGINTASGITGITALSSSLIQQIREFKNIEKLGQESVELQASSRLLKIGRAAGKASIVLTIASIGLDVGLSVVELKKRKDELEHSLTQLNYDLTKISQDITELQKELKNIESLTNQLLLDVDPQLTIESWADWVETKKEELVHLQEHLVAFEGIINQATKIAEVTKGESYQLRIQLIQNLDPRISEQLASALISAANK